MTTIAWGSPSQTRTSHARLARPVARPVPAAGESLVLTRRGRMVVVALVLLVMLALAGLFANGASADSLGEPVSVAVHTVSPGETLWHIAAAATPAGDDVRNTIDEVLALNAMSSVDLAVGQQLLVPQP